jgi:uncharacterized protein YhfF
VFNAKDFGTSGMTWKGVALEDCIFDDEDLEIQAGEGVAEIIHQAMITGSSSQFVGIADDDPVLVNGESFTVVNWKDDGTGVIEVFLKRVTA